MVEKLTDLASRRDAGFREATAWGKLTGIEEQTPTDSLRFQRCSSRSASTGFSSQSLEHRGFREEGAPSWIFPDEHGGFTGSPTLEMEGGAGKKGGCPFAEAETGGETPGRPPVQDSGSSLTAMAQEPDGYLMMEAGLDRQPVPELEPEAEGSPQTDVERRTKPERSRSGGASTAWSPHRSPGSRRETSGPCSLC